MTQIMNADTFYIKKFFGLGIMSLLVFLPLKVDAVDALKMGFVLPHTGNSAEIGANLFNGIETAIKELNQSANTIEKGEYSLNCKDAAKTTQELITQKSVNVLLSIQQDMCTLTIKPIANRYGILHISLVVNEVTSRSNFWLSVLSSDVAKSRLEMKVGEKPTLPKKLKENIIVHIEELFDSFKPPKRYRLRKGIDIIGLREKPEKPGNEPNPKDNPIKHLVKQENILIEQATTKDRSETEKYCRKSTTNTVWDWIYTKDWKCVMSFSDQSKIGWIHRLLVKEVTNNP